MEQRTDDWFAARCGRVTASRIADVMAKRKDGKPSSDRANYRAQLVVERLTGAVEASYCSPAMQWGVDTESEAREAYRRHMLCTVEEIGFVEHPSLYAGASPDGLIGGDGLLEIKCPLTATHIDTLLNRMVPDKYVKQMQFQMACTGRTWCDFASYDPRVPEPMRLFVARLPRDDAFIAEIEAEVESFLAEVDETVAKLEAQFAAQLEAA